MNSTATSYNVVPCSVIKSLKCVTHVFLSYTLGNHEVTIWGFLGGREVNFSLVD